MKTLEEIAEGLDDIATLGPRNWTDLVRKKAEQIKALVAQSRAPGSNRGAEGSRSSECINAAPQDRKVGTTADQTLSAPAVAAPITPPTGDARRE